MLKQDGDAVRPSCPAIGTGEREAPQYGCAVVVLVDIIGFSELVSQSDPYPAEPLRALNELRSLGPNDKVKDKSGMRYVTASDTAVLVVPYEPSHTWRSLKAALFSACEWVSNWQRALLGQRILLRGGLTRGHIYCDADRGIVFGPALGRAHELESKTAFFPRVVIDEAVVAETRKEYPCVTSDPDGIWFLDYIRPDYLRVIDSDYENLTRDTRLLNLHKKAVLYHLSLARRPDQLAKCNRLIEYHNLTVRPVIAQLNTMQLTNRSRWQKQASECIIGDNEIARALGQANAARPKPDEDDQTRRRSIKGSHPTK